MAEENNTQGDATPKVTIYSTPTCVYCKMAKEFFGEHNVKYEEYNVAEDEEKRNEMFEKTGQMGVPVISVDDRVMVGFNEEALTEMLNIK